MKYQIDWVKVNEEDNNDENDEDGYEDFDDEPQHRQPMIIIGGDQGQGGITDWLRKRLNKYELHSNFRLTQSISEAIAGTDGVEAIRVLTPYRAIIAIGKLFEDSTVQLEVKREIDRIKQTS